MEAMLLLSLSGSLCGLGVSAQHEFCGNPTVLQVLTCPGGLSHTERTSQAGTCDRDCPLQLWGLRAARLGRLRSEVRPAAARGSTLKESRGHATGLLPTSLRSPGPAYLFDGTLEAGLLVLHPVDLSEGAPAQAGLARGPVDLLSVLIIHRLEFLGLAGERGQCQWPGRRGDDGLQ